MLREKISQAAQDKERLYAKYQKIQDFHTLTVSAGKLRTIPVSDEMAYHKILKKKKRLVYRVVQLLWTLPSISAAVLSSCLQILLYPRPTKLEGGILDSFF